MGNRHWPALEDDRGQAIKLAAHVLGQEIVAEVGLDRLGALEAEDKPEHDESNRSERVIAQAAVSVIATSQRRDTRTPA
jgi:hypothetical protein